MVQLSRPLRLPRLARALVAVLVLGAGAPWPADARSHSTRHATTHSSRAKSAHGAPAAPVPVASGEPERPRLVLQLIVDQLRGDLALRVRDHWAKGGFRRLYDEGAVFSGAHHAHANTETIVGHATLATGADPSVHGMVGNVWLDRSTGEMHYNIEDPSYAVVGNDAPPGEPAQGPVKNTRGRSPLAMRAPTLADSFAAAGGGKAKVFAVSMKDRGAVPMAGESGKALWWSDQSGEFISSTYYYPNRQLPDWVQKFNSMHPADKLAGRSWSLLLGKKSAYQFGTRDDQPWECPPVGMTRVFPHRLDRKALTDGFYAAVESTPFADDLLVDFTLALVRGEQIGEDDVIDYLSVSLSALDFIGHRYGPNSLEEEDELLRIDRAIEKLLSGIDKAVGAGRTIVVLSADHGIADAPEDLAARGLDSGRVLLSEVQKTATVEDLEKRAGKDLLKRWPPYIYLDDKALKDHGIAPDKAERDVAAEVAKLPGVAQAFTRSDIQSGKLPNTQVARAVERNFFPERSGDIYVVPKYGWQISFELPTSLQFATGHGSPWDYDSFVPLVFAGPGVKHTEVRRWVETVDAAPTIAALAGVAAPAKATGHVLREALAPPPSEQP